TAQADAMRAAASNQGGAMTGFMGLGMAQNAGGINAQDLYGMGQAQQQKQMEQNAQSHVNNVGSDSWLCSCGNNATGKFCTECGAKRQEAGWTCAKCGTSNTGKFCSECGEKKPEAGNFECKSCGWKVENLESAPKFCPECGTPMK
ncbi:MAG: SPFH domain-containing protein, partial [Peptostreptococcus porci]|nr:SPFH domain-containing protein [Peptostreptococcus porci]